MSSVSKSFREGKAILNVLRDISFDINSGEIVALIGPSGSGKTTLLQIVGLLDRPDNGKIQIGKFSCHSISDNERTKIRRSQLGFVYQFHHLLPEFSAIENVALPMRIAGHNKDLALKNSIELLQNLGLDQRLHHRPNELSGGERQRVAIARAISNKPSILLADEPTGNLDYKTSEDVFDSLYNLLRSKGVTSLIATHNPELAKRMDRRLQIINGLLVEV